MRIVGLRRSRLILTLICFVLVYIWTSTPLLAQETDRLRGMVVDGGNKNALPGGSVRILPDGLHGNTDLNGQFVFTGLQHGDKTIIISYMGYQERRVEVDADDLDDLVIIELTPITSDLNEIVVTATIDGQQKALNQQRSADNIKNIISADVMGRFPDLNVAEALQRVPGINIQRNKGEGSTIALRGTPQHFTTVQINGEQLPSVQQGGSRNEALDLIPSDQLASIEIIKAPTPDLDGDAIGGIVNLRTPTANRLRWSGKAEGALGYNDISGGLNGIGKLRIDKRFMSSTSVPEGKLGVMLSGSYYSSNNSEDRLNAVWNGIPRPLRELDTEYILPEDFGFRKTMNDRERMGLTGTFDYKPNGFNHLVLNYMYNRRVDNDLQNRLRYDFDRGPTEWVNFQRVDGARARRDINIWDEEKNNHSFSLQGYHTLESWQVDWAASYARSNRDFTSTRGDFSYDNIDLVIENDQGIFSEFPIFRSSDQNLDLHDPLLYNDFRRYEEDFETTVADNLVFRADISKQMSLFDSPFKLKFGGKYRMQSNSKFRDNQVLSFFDPNGVLNLSEAYTRVVGDKEPLNFLFNDYRFGPMIDRTRFTDYIHRNRFLLTEADDAWDARRLSLNDTYDAYEDIYAGYAMGRLQLGNLMVLGGLRLESNVVNYDAFEVFRSGTDVEWSPITGGNDFAFLLPHLHLKYALDKWTNIRVSVLRNYARPNFVDIVPFVNYDVDATTLRLGNPELTPSTAWNVDAMLEHYFPNAGIVSLGLFYKDINHFQFTRLINNLEVPFPGYAESVGFEFRQEQNGKRATVAGAEVNIYRALDFLPGILKGLAVNANYTFAYSNAHTQDRSDIRLPGQADHTFNAMLSFNYKDFTIRGSVNYNGSYAESIASQQQEDIIQRYRTQLDLNASYKWRKFRIYTEWINLLNEPSVRYQGDESRISRMSCFGYGARYGISYSF